MNLTVFRDLDLRSREMEKAIKECAMQCRPKGFTVTTEGIVKQKIECKRISENEGFCRVDFDRRFVDANF